ncbi:Lysophospholipase L1 [Luteibacter sp. UNCMF331Sha3.1]|uniref:GDSL-type esterase/lipase family protein n=1 Tax=Luteibacter sp. UNCMF331Sha3.1 TaxID=1502760 RepID=UPI0008ACC9E7|nr:GDSL-type esterase/lipase family protein [Luteibacter sp. UNCMF331Sha3.1]SEM39701.1 Lysophospholipase L1 [Luteibacter sp. UNCMF331Sha3.1]
MPFAPSSSRLALALALAFGAAGAAHAAATTPWVGTWAVSAKPIGETDFAGQTLRQIVHTSIAGHAARIRLSNANGDGPLTLSNVHVAQSAGGSSTKADTDRQVTFGGRTTITLAAGEEIVSDSVAVTVPALSDLVVSFYVPQATHAITGHDFSSQTRYQAQGDVAGQPQIQAWADANYAFLTNVDVQGDDPQGAVVTLGASITDGYNSTFNANTRWPNDLAVRLAAAGKNIGVLNQGISGNRLLHDGAGLSATNRFTHDALDQTGVRWIVFSDDPINDLGDRPVPSAANLIDAERDLIARAHARGIKVLCSTLTPFEGSDHWSPEGETARGQINAFIRGGDSGCDGVIDQDLATHDPQRPTWFLPAYDGGDHLHPNDAGYQAIANAVNLNFFTKPSVPVIATPQGCGSIGPGEGLLIGQTVVSCDGGYRLDLQGDSNAVLYKAGVPLWNTATVDRDAAGLRLDADGNFVLYSAFGTTLWQSGSGGHDTARLFVQGDGNMVIYDNAGPIWNTGTAGR